MRSLRFVALTAAAAAAFLAPAAAHASPDYPTAITAHLGLAAAPQCTICHTDNNGGKGTVTKPFGLSMRAHGLVSGSDTSLFAALDAMTADKTDSTCDGTPDIDDLKAGRDPNVADSDAGATSCATPAGNAIAPEYGCVGRIAPKGKGDGTIAGAVLALVAILRRWTGRREDGKV